MAEYKIKLSKADEDILENDLTDIDSWIQSAGPILFANSKAWKAWAEDHGRRVSCDSFWVS